MQMSFGIRHCEKDNEDDVHNGNYEFSNIIIVGQANAWPFCFYSESRRFDVFCRSLSYHPIKLNLASETCSRWT